MRAPTHLSMHLVTHLVTATLVTLVALVTGCAAKSPRAEECAKGRVRLDGACVSPEVADYVACVRAQAAKLAPDVAAKLSREAGEAASAATGARLPGEVSARLEQRYAAEPGPVEVLQACADLRGPPGERAACMEAGKLGEGCGFLPDAEWASRCPAGPIVGCLMMRGPTCESIALCGFEGATRKMCGSPSTPSGTTGCSATLDCYAACKGDLPCECRCTGAMAPTAALGVGLVSQCYERKCKGCEADGRGECARCFRRACQGTFDAHCKGR